MDDVSCKATKEEYLTGIGTTVKSEIDKGPVFPQQINLPLI